MPASLYLGPARSGKTAALLQTYRDALAGGETGGMPSPQSGVGMYRALWLAPNARTASIIRGQLLSKPSPFGRGQVARGDSPWRGEGALSVLASCLRPGVMTFRDLSALVIAESRRRIQLLPTLVDRELVRRTWHGLKPMLQFFAQSADRPGFVDLLTDHIRELKRNAVTPDVYAKARPPRAAVDQHRELALLYQNYEEQLAAHGLADEEGQHGIARDLLAAGSPKCLQQLELVVADGFTDFTSTQREILQLLAERSKQLIVTLPYDDPAVAGLSEAGPSGLAGVTDPSYSRASAPRSDLFAKTAATWHGLQSVLQDTQHFPPQPLPWPALDHAVRHIFRNPARVPPPSPEAIASLDRLEIVAAASAHDEIVQIARRIKARLLADRSSPDDIAVVFRSLTDAAPRIREVFTEYGIPFYLEADLSVGAAPVTRTLQSLLKLTIDDWPFRRVVGVVTDNTLTAIAPAARQAADWLIRDLQIAEGGDKLLHRIEHLAAIDTPLDQLSDQRQRRVAGAKAALPAVQLLSTALSELPREATPLEWRDALAKLAATLGFFPPLPQGEGRGEGALDLAAWHAIASHLATLERLDGWLGQPPRKLTLHELLTALSEVAAHARLPRGHDEVGRVRVLSAQSARTLPVKHLFFAGMSEQSFPSPERPGRLATDADYRFFSRVKEQKHRGLSGHHRRDGRAESAEQKGTVPFIEPTRAQEEMLLFYELLSRADESLTISYAALDDKAQDLPPSPYVLELQRVFGENNLRITPPQLSPVPSRSGEPSRTSLDGLQSVHARTEVRPTIECRSARGTYSPTDLRLQAVARALDKDTDAHLLAGMFTSPSTSPVAQSIDAGLRIVRARACTESHGSAEGIITSPAVEARLKRRFGSQHLWSPSQWESYAACPFRFFLENVLGLEPLGDLTLEVDHRRRGSLAHDMLAMFHGKHRDVPLAEWASLLGDEQRFEQELHNTLQEVLSSTGIPHDGIEAALLELDRREIAKWIARYRAHYEKYDGSWSNLDAPMMPTHFELRFGYARPGETSPEDESSVDKPFPLDIGGETVLVTGRIDRIDVGQVGGKKVFNVIDYKSGQRPTHTREKVLSGERLQPAIYVMAAQTLLFGDDQAMPMWAGYWSMKTGVTTSEKYSLRCAVEADQPSEAWDELQSAVKDRIREFVRAIRAGQFPVASRDPDCTSRCDFHTTCRIAQIRSLGKQWQDMVESRESRVESQKAPRSKSPAPSP